MNLTQGFPHNGTRFSEPIGGELSPRDRFDIRSKISLGGVGAVYWAFGRHLNDVKSRSREPSLEADSL